jgi:hypothetical protein
LLLQYLDMGRELIGLIIRILSGEPYRKATPWELRFYSATFAIIPIMLLLVSFFPGVFSYIDKLGTVGLYVWWFVCVGVGIALFAVWLKLVPAAVSWTLATVAWVAVIWLAFAGKLGR